MSKLQGGVLGVGHFGTRVLGLVWAGIALSYLVSASLLLARSSSWTSVALGASALSLLMCVLFWPEARIGSYIDVALLLVVLLFSRSGGDFLARSFAQELREARLPKTPPAPEMVDEQAIAGLPESTKRYLRFMGAVGRPRDWALRAHFRARFRREPGEWLDCEVFQYDTRLKVSRLFLMQLSLKHVLPVTVRDTYLSGHGRMRAKAFDLFPVVDAQGHELDVGELVTYLNDAILMAPSLLLGPETTWQEVDPTTFDVTLRDGSLSVKARVWLDERGAPQDFSTTDRFYDTPDGKRVRTEWRTPINGWQVVNGRRIPTSAAAVWQLPEGPFMYADFIMDPREIAFNEPPL
ncbi:MAG TPA: DUF6544 family protein [Polyangiaceae bacterium]|nr:DUF6544 family protein [Polyangiaceae bacterium]